jgi:hypothetical protein
LPLSLGLIILISKTKTAGLAQKNFKREPSAQVCFHENETMETRHDSRIQKYRLS